MANNRMWIVCPVCDAHYMIAKATASWSARVDNDKFDEFLREHDTCGFKLDPPWPLGTTIHFTLKYEHTTE